MNLATLSDPLPLTSAKVELLPCVIYALDAMQKYVLGRVAVHNWTHRGEIPYIPPNPHQASIAFGLAVPGVRLLLPTSLMPSYKLSRLGDIAVHRLFRFVDVNLDHDREREFDRMRALVRNDWETSD
jgi:hypothetical protein